MQYCESKSRKTLAAFIDFYCIPMVIGLVLNIIVAVVGKSIVQWYFPIILLVVDLALVIAYHAALSGKARILTLGELMSGRIRVNGEKKWINPYCRNRAVLYVFAFIVLILYGNSFDSLFEGAIPSLPSSISKAIGVILAIAGLVLAARGKVNGILIPAAIMLLGAVLLLIKGASGANQPMGILFLAISINGIITWVIYRRARSAVGEITEADGAGKNQGEA